ncbi:MAG: SIR2-like domain-containing protein [Candidatus Kentron sp. G]|nr:MAG: SIR2-like domain-containing protein [Candidatus Kentron sp. G]VFN04513.1 MAG: SIR2-like domain-containing protein [Candidatus Kentron sp. G]VFN05878.1 MAG: SIR2-like domain-containing protein [Candidatus Kentron sp. G]
MTHRELARGLLAGAGMQPAGANDCEVPLSEIAQYYQRMPDYTRGALLRNLNEQLSRADPDVSLYRLLARVDQPLLIISTAYDESLETALTELGKPFVRITPLAGQGGGYDPGRVRLSYFQEEKPKEEPPAAIAHDELSALNPMEEGYTIVYKVLGVCAGEGLNPNADTAIAVTEEDFFHLTGHRENLFPEHLISRFGSRPFWFLGYKPERWEDRMLAGALLRTHSGQNRPFLVVDKHMDAFQEAFWNDRSRPFSSLSHGLGRIRVQPGSRLALNP